MTATLPIIDDQLDCYEAAAREHERRVQAAIARVERDEDLKGHLDALGMPDAEAYRQWCRQQGLSTRLAKSALARDDELDLMRRVDSWRFSKADHQRLIRLRRFARRGAWDIPGRAIETLVATAADEHVGPSVESRRRYVELLTAFAVGFPHVLRDENIPVWIAGSLAVVARAAETFARDPEDWEPQGGHTYASALRSFLHHTFVRFERPPHWAEAIWVRDHAPHPAEVVRYLRLADGHGLDMQRLPFPVTRRAARLSYDAPKVCQTFLSALRYGEARAFGATRSMAKAIATSGIQFETEPFWSTVVQWLATHADYPADAIGELRNYIYEVRVYTRWTCDERGRWVAGPADPDWKIAGRSTASLRREIEAINLYNEDCKAKQFTSDRPPARPDRVVVDGKRDSWLMVPVEDEAQFFDEGRSMSHCVATYREEADRGELAIYSLRSLDGKELRRRVTICVRPAIGISEARGFANRKPTQAELCAIATWAKRRRISMRLLEA